MDDCATRQGATHALRLTGLEAALSAWLALVPRPVAPTLLPPAEAVGRVLAETIRTAAPVPPVAVALREGWAVASAETLGAGPYAPAPLPSDPPWLQPGDPLPPGTDAVLPPFDLLREGPYAQATQPVAPGEGARQPGEDIAAGTTLRAAGERLRVQDLPALAALGQARAAVRIPRVACIGADEAVATMLAGLAAQGGAAWTALPEPAAATVPPVTAAHDLLLLAGEAGPRLLAASGRLLVRGVGARPGEPTAFGVVADRPVLLLPRQPEDAVAAWMLFVRPALAALAGVIPLAPRRVRLAAKVASTVGLAELALLRLDDAGALPLAVGSLPLAALSAADALLVVPPGSEGYEAGTDIPVLPL